MAPTPSRMWKLLAPTQRLRAAQALWREDEAKSDQIQAEAAIAQQRKLRPKTVASLDAERKAQYLASVSSVPEALAARLLVLYHLAEQRPMMGTFLDAIGLPHDNGLIQDDAAPPDPAKLPGGAAAIALAYPAQDVALYLNTLIWQDPSAWGALEATKEAHLT